MEEIEEDPIVIVTIPMGMAAVILRNPIASKTVLTIETVIDPLSMGTPTIHVPQTPIIAIVIVIVHLPIGTMTMPTAVLMDPTQTAVKIITGVITAYPSSFVTSPMISPRKTSKRRLDVLDLSGMCTFHVIFIRINPRALPLSNMPIRNMPRRPKVKWIGSTSRDENWRFCLRKRSGRLRMR